MSALGKFRQLPAEALYLGPTWNPRDWAVCVATGKCYKCSADAVACLPYCGGFRPLCRDCGLQLGSWFDARRTGVVPFSLMAADRAARLVNALPRAWQDRIPDDAAMRVVQSWDRDAIRAARAAERAQGAQAGVR